MPIAIPGVDPGPGAGNIGIAGGPGTGGKNTKNGAKNKYTKQDPGSVFNPTLSPSEIQAAYAQLGNLASSHQLDVAALRAQRAGLKAGLKPAILGIRRETVAGMAQVENQAIGQGLWGGSSPIVAQLSIFGQGKQAATQQRLSTLQQLQQLRIQQKQGTLAWQSNMIALQEQMAAQRQAALQSQFQTELSRRLSNALST